MDVKKKQKEAHLTSDEGMSSTNGYHLSGRIDEGPKNKIAKLDSLQNGDNTDLAVNPKYTSKEFTRILKSYWSAKGKEYTKNNETGVEVFTEPFQLCILSELLQSNRNCKLLVSEIEKIQWSRKQMDLYEFYQSTDLSNMTESITLTKFLHMLRRNVRPWLEKVTNLKLDYVSASCSMYTCGDYLLVHDDLLKDRQIAFVYYLSPWQGAEQWTGDHGGCLEIFNSDARCFPQFPVRHKISPKNNQFVFFKVGSRSFHQVGEVTTFDYPRLTINGWFHGASNDDVVVDSLRPFTKFSFKAPQSDHGHLELFLNEVYLKPVTRKSIQKRIEDNSEICLYEFFRREIFVNALKQLVDDNTLKWRRKGPANAQNYEILELSTATSTIEHLIQLFASAEMFNLLRDYTDLDLAGPNAAKPSYSLELQRWSCGNYTVLGDGAICEENTLDLVCYLNASDGAAVITYLSPETDGGLTESDTTKIDNDVDGHTEVEDLNNDEDESVLLTISPVDNSLNIVYRCEGTTKFTKYVSHNTPLEKGPVFVIACSYKE